MMENALGNALLNLFRLMEDVKSVKPPIAKSVKILI
jgi:hypothetical protein